MSLPNRTFRSRLLRKWKLLIVLVCLSAAAAYFAGQFWIGRKVESVLKESFVEHGLTIGWKRSFWNPWRGMVLDGLVIRELTGDTRPVAELDNLALMFSLFQFLGNGDQVIFLHVSDANLSLHDVAGSVRLKHVSLQMRAKEGELLITRIEAQEDGLTARLSGKVITSALKSSEPFKLDLSAIRGTLEALDVSPNTGPFRVTGSFIVDARSSEVPWSANLNGIGENFEWNGILLRKGTAEAALSSEDSRIKAELNMPVGSAKGTILGKGWDESPFLLSGSVQDSIGRSDEFEGSFGDQMLKINRLSGAANLWELAANLPAASDMRADGIVIKDFPDIDIRGLEGNFSKSPPEWKFNSLTAKGSGVLMATIDGHEVRAENLSGEISYDGRQWILDDVMAKTMGGTLSVSGNYQNGNLSRSEIEAEGMRLSDYKRMTDTRSGKASPGVLSVSYKGSVSFGSQNLDGRGSLRLENAPVFEVPLLDQVYDLFNAIIPGSEKSEEGRFDARFTADSRLIDVTHFEAKGGSLTVSAVGTVNLETSRVNGKARGKLVGLPGLLTSPLSRLLEMDVAGPFDDIRVKPLGPAKLASNAASVGVGTVNETLEEAGNITGEVLKEGIKMPFKWFKKKAE